ncbi:MAG: L,D-transpeptidase family protein [Methyloceanibacter sp.]|nr:L,D-transpeptidase family protein [Methyloceanibacter sp.]
MSAVAVLRRRKTWTIRAGANMQTLNILTSVSTAALVAAALWVAPAAAEDGGLADPDDPMTIIVSLPNQRAKVFRGTSEITSTAVSTGKRGYATKAGVYSILEKRRRHFSNLYAGAPMPWMQRLTWTGTALHAGKIPGYPASHGCIRLPYSFAPKLFKMTEVGGQVVVAHSMVEPKRISHPALFQPLPPPMPPELLSKSKAAAQPMRKSSVETSPKRPFRLPVIFAKASGIAQKPISNTASTRLALVPATTGAIQRAQDVKPSHSLEDTTQHAIDPNAAPFVGSGAHAVASKSPATVDGGTTEVENSDDFVKHQDRLEDRLADSEGPKAQDRLDEDAAAPEAELTEQPEAQPQEAALTPAPEAETVEAEEAKTAESETAEEANAAAESAEATETRLASVEPEAIALATAPQASEPSVPAAVDEDPIAELARETAPGTEPAAEPALAVSAATLEAKATQPLALSLSVLGVNDHPPRPLERPSVMLSRLKAGAKSAAVEAADPVSQEPLRILVTRRTTRDRTVDLQYILSDMGYLAPQNFDGTRGSATIRALKKFQKDNEMPVTGAFTDDVFKKVYEVAGKKEPSEGQLFVRQKFASVFSIPVSFRDPEKPLGTHLFTIMHFEPGATEADWTAISLNDKATAESVLNRIDIPADVRQRISERLTPGSSLIVADTAINSAALPKGADFLVWDTSKPQVHRASTSPRRKVRKRTTRRPSYTRERSRSRYSRRSPRRGVFGF